MTILLQINLNCVSNYGILLICFQELLCFFEEMLDESEAYLMVWISYNFKNKREDRALESSLWVWKNYTLKWAYHQQAMLLLPGSNKSVKVYNLIYLFGRFSDYNLAATVVLYHEKRGISKKDSTKTLALNVPLTFKTYLLSQWC